MFDLFRSRDKAVRYLLGSLLMVVALSMVITLIPGFGSGTSTTETIVAEVGKEAITLRDVQKALANAQRNRSMPPEMLQFFIPQLVDQMITERAIAFEAGRLGFEVTESDTANAIRNIVPQLFQEGKFVGKETYSAFLEQQGLSIPEFESQIARQVLLNRVRGIALQSIVVSPVEIEREFRNRNEKAKIEFVKIDQAKYRAEAAVSQAEMLDHFNRNKASFSVPEKRALKLLVLDPAKFTGGVVVSDDDIRKAYESSKDRYRTGERVKIRHILLKTTGKPKEEHPKIRAKMEDILKKLQGGADFADLAKKNSEDPGSAVKGGDLDWVVRGQMVKNFEQASFSLKVKELSGIVETEYGYHVLQVMEKEDARLKPFEEVKQDIAGELKTQRSRDASQSALDTLQVAMRKGVPNPEKFAAEHNLTAIPVEKAGPNDALPELGVSEEMQAMLRSLPKGGVSTPVPSPLGRYVVAVVTDVFPAHPAEFSEVMPQIKTLLEGSKLASVAGTRANELFTKAQQAGDLKKAAQSMGLELKSPPEFTRSGAVEGLGTGAVVADAFARASGTLIGPIPVGEAFIVARVVARLDSDLSELGPQRDSIKEEIKARKSRERSELFEDGFRQQLVKEGKVKIYDAVIKNLIANYRG